MTAAELERRLDEIMEVEFSFRNTAGPAASIATLPLSQQKYLLDWSRRVASANTELGFQYSCHAVDALSFMEQEMVEAWALHAMDMYDREGLRPALAVLQQSMDFIERNRERTQGIVLADKENIMQGFLNGLSGRKLKLAESDLAYTDTETIYLPPVEARLTTREDNFLLYKSTVAMLWSQIHYGTFRVPLLQEMERYEEPQRFLQLFQSLENLRLEGIISRELPGLYRELTGLKNRLSAERLPPEWIEIQHNLIKPDTTAEDVLGLTHQMIQIHQTFIPNAWQGVLRPAEAHACMQARIEKEKIQLRVILKMLEDDLTTDDNRTEQKQSRFSMQRTENTESFRHDELELLLDGKPLPVSEEVKALMSSIIVDLSNIPDEYLQPAGPGEYDPSLLLDEQREADDVWSGVYHEEGAFLYPEWDFQRRTYRKNWCAVREQTVSPVFDGFIEETMERYSVLLKQLRKTFEALRDDNRLLKRQKEGEDVDLDALVEALVDARDGSEMSQRLFTRMHRTERNIAVLFMVDMSGSTQGWINQAERESLLLLCESLERLGDRYAIYGFSGNTRKRCELYHVKHFQEPYDREIKARISGIRPHDYTRMGFAIRHLSKVLNEIDAKTRILITLSDGKPDDYDNYRGEYGIEDTRRALIEARRDGIHPYCITIDEQARDYLPHLYGPAAYTVVDDVRQLPVKVSDIYRKLTTT